MIKLQVIGNLGRDCVVNNVSGRSVINFSVAHTEKFRDAQGNTKERTTWVECAYWTDRTAIAPYLRKGTQVYVEGQPEVRSYTTNDGRQGASLSVRVQSVQLLGGGRADNAGSDSGSYGNSAGNTSGSSYAPAPGPIESTPDDLPF